MPDRPGVTGPGIMSIGDGKDDIVDALRAVYCQVLDIPVEEVDINSSFIALGGKKSSPSSLQGI